MDHKQEKREKIEENIRDIFPLMKEDAARALELARKTKDLAIELAKEDSSLENLELVSDAWLSLGLLEGRTGHEEGAFEALDQMIRIAQAMIYQEPSEKLYFEKARMIRETERLFHKEFGYEFKDTRALDQALVYIDHSLKEGINPEKLLLARDLLLAVINVRLRQYYDALDQKNAQRIAEALKNLIEMDERLCKKATRKTVGLFMDDLRLAISLSIDLRDLKLADTMIKKAKRLSIALSSQDIQGIGLPEFLTDITLKQIELARLEGDGSKRDQNLWMLFEMQKALFVGQGAKNPAAFEKGGLVDEFLMYAIRLAFDPDDGEEEKWIERKNSLIEQFK